MALPLRVKYTKDDTKYEKHLGDPPAGSNPRTRLLAAGSATRNAVKGTAKMGAGLTLIGASWVGSGLLWIVLFLSVGYALLYLFVGAAGIILPPAAHTVRSWL